MHCEPEMDPVLEEKNVLKDNFGVKWQKRQEKKY